MKAEECVKADNKKCVLSIWLDLCQSNTKQKETKIPLLHPKSKIRHQMFVEPSVLPQESNVTAPICRLTHCDHEEGDHEEFAFFRSIPSRARMAALIADLSTLNQQKTEDCSLVPGAISVSLYSLRTSNDQQQESVGDISTFAGDPSGWLLVSVSSTQNGGGGRRNLCEEYQMRGHTPEWPSRRHVAQGER